MTSNDFVWSTDSCVMTELDVTHNQLARIKALVEGHG